MKIHSKKVLSKKERGGVPTGTLSTKGTQGTKEVPGGFEIVEVKWATIKNISPSAMKFFRFIYANYGVSKAKALDILISHFLKTHEFEGKNQIQINIDAHKPISIIEGSKTKIASLELGERLKTITEIIDTGTYYKLVNGTPVKAEVGYRQILLIHSELRRKLMDTTLPDGQRAEVAMLLERFTEMFQNKVEYDREYIKRECERGLGQGEKFGPSYNETLRETLIPKLKEAGKKKKDLIEDEPVKEIHDAVFDELRGEFE